MPRADASAHRRSSGGSEPSRRGFLLGAGGAIVVAGGAGAAVGVLRSRTQPDVTPQTPTVLAQAQQAELDLLAGLAATLKAGPANADALRTVQADHSAHLAAIGAAISMISGPSPRAQTLPAAQPRSTAQLRSAEQAASVAAAARALQLDGADAALLASIAACEDSHAELLA